LGDVARALAIKAAGIESAAVLGFTSAIGACGGYLIPRGFGASIAATGGPNLALEVFLTFYVTCVALTWWFLAYPVRCQSRSRVSPVAAVEFFIRGG
jgi:NNP family nitrate/nitrite transporter-like MFS transporter